jgi:thiol-disulfide isomerase/thioredoxin
VKLLIRALMLLIILCASGAVALVLAPASREVSSAPTFRDAAAEESQRLPAGQFTPVDPPRPAPALAFTSRDGKALNLTDFRGRFVLVNLWATWCVPCVREMPSLDRLQARLGGRLLILAVSEDRGGGRIVEPFLQKLGLASLAIFLDPSSSVQQALQARGLPTSVLVDPQGAMLASLEGAAEWDSPEMLARLESYMRASSSGTSIIKTSMPR